MHPPMNPQQSREELLRKEEAKKEEQARAVLVVQLNGFDAYDYYEQIRQWSVEPVHFPAEETVYVTPIRTEKVFSQVLPITRKQLRQIHQLSSKTARLLYLLRAIDQKGMECPYIHMQEHATLDMALDRCGRLIEAITMYMQTRGLKNRFLRLVHGSHLHEAKQEIIFFKARLEAVYILCRQYEFALDLQKMKGMMIYQDRSSLGAAPIPAPVPFVNVPKGQAKATNGAQVYRRDLKKG